MFSDFKSVMTIIADVGCLRSGMKAETGNLWI